MNRTSLLFTTFRLGTRLHVLNDILWVNPVGNPAWEKWCDLQSPYRVIGVVPNFANQLIQGFLPLILEL